MEGDGLAGLWVAQRLPAQGVEGRITYIEVEPELEVAGGGVGAGLQPGVAQAGLSEELIAWLKNPILPEISDEDRAKLRAFDLDELSSRFRQLLEEQKERHDGGNRWIGTGGTSPFVHGGALPTGRRQRPIAQECGRQPAAHSP